MGGGGEDENSSLPFEKGVNTEDFNCCNINLLLVACHWKDQLTRKIMTFRKEHYNIAGQNGITVYHFISIYRLKGWRTQLYIVFIFTSSFLSEDFKSA